MVESQIAARGVSDPRVLEAMRRVPREEFVPAGRLAETCGDWALPIGLGQTISQPYTVAYMIEALGLRGHETVLEVGSGSGYGAAVLATLARAVHTIERHSELAARARATLARLGYHNVIVHEGDGSRGLPQFAPFDGICCTAAAPRLPAPLAEQLADGGRLVIPIGPTRDSQHLLRYTRHGAEFEVDNLGAFAFVPLVASFDAPREA